MDAIERWGVEMMRQSVVLIAAAVACAALAGESTRPKRTGGDMALRQNTHVVRYVPIDLSPLPNIRMANGRQAIQGTSKQCGERGEPSSDVHAHCSAYCSESDASCWVIRFVEPKHVAERVFEVQGDKLVLHLQVDLKDTSRLLYLSESAKRFASEKR